VELCLLPLKPGDHIWQTLPDGGTWHGVFVGKFILAPSDDGAALVLADGEEAETLPNSVVAVDSSAGAIARMSLQEFMGEPGTAAAADAVAGTGDGADGASLLPAEGESSAAGGAGAVNVRLYTRRPRQRREAVGRALRIVGLRVDAQSLKAFPQMLPWWAIFDDTEALQPGLCATRAKAVRFRLAPRRDEPIPPAVMNAILQGGAVVRQGRVVLRGVRLMRVLRLTKAACAGWANLGSFVGQAIAASVLDDGDSSTAVATAAGGWAGSLAGGGAAAVAVSTMGVEGLGAGSMVGGLVVCSSLSAAGAVAGAGLAYAAKKKLEQRETEVVRSAEYHDGPLRLIGDANDVFHLFDATLEFPSEDMDDEGLERLTAIGWYAVRVQPGSSVAASKD